ncbi:hypothetical protein DWB68_10270 [Galactobacter valiniphilus]|uniref:Uncharacterized protein n=1 Tax=Galactobacter valiniphilus TaxID=2676122 RepID=A0A399JCZ3_9MICC|nr:hypothetical protein DWB68_10270 [Galactobacter valiniphilus]
MGSVRDARFLSGADLGRTIRVERIGYHLTGTLERVEHELGTVSFTIRRGTAEYLFEVSPHDAVTITGADA